MNKKYDLIVYIGRFQPPHLAHIEIIKKAESMAEDVLVLIGSANQPRTIKNPWTWQERADMIFASLTDEEVNRVHIDPLQDHVYNNSAWLEQVQELAAEWITLPDSKIGIIGHDKDETSFYLKCFPQWEMIDVDIIDDLHATDIRKEMFENKDVDEKLPSGIRDYIKSFMLSTEYEKLLEEYKFQLYHDRMWDMDKMLDHFVDKEMNNYERSDHDVVLKVISTLRKDYRVAPYKPYFNTVDTVVIQSGHVLLVRRRSAPGKGLYAIPGGYLKHNEWSIDGALRELREETKIKVPLPVLQGNIKTMHVYEHPNRSSRGRIITHAYIIELPDGELPKIKGSDDADKARWVPLNVFKKMQDQMFEDHAAIINDLISKIKRKG